MSVHNHSIDPSCRERIIDGQLRGDCTHGPMMTPEECRFCFGEATNDSGPPSLASETTEPPTLEQMLDCLELAAKESDDFADDGRAATARWLLAALPSLLADRDRVTECVAEAIYDAMRDHDPEGKHRPWVPGGNSLKQDEARSRARAALTPTLDRFARENRMWADDIANAARSTSDQEGR